MSYVVWFDEFDPSLAARLGGKCTALGELTQAGLDVPPGFAVTTDAYVAACGPLTDRLRVLLADAAARPGGPGAHERDDARPRRGCPAARRPARRGGRGVRRPVPAVRDGGRAGGRPVVGGRGGRAGGELRRRARHVPVGARRGRGPGRGAPVLGEPVHRAGDGLPARGSLRRRTPGTGPARRWASPSSRWCSPRSRASPSPSTRRTATGPRSPLTRRGASGRRWCPARSPRTTTSSTRSSWRSPGGWSRTRPSSTDRRRVGVGSRGSRCPPIGAPSRACPTSRSRRWPGSPSGRSGTTAARRTSSGRWRPTRPVGTGCSSCRAGPRRCGAGARCVR